MNYMEEMVNTLLLALNMKAEKENIAYSYTIERAYSGNKKCLFTKRRVLKFKNFHLEEKIIMPTMLDFINYLNKEIKTYK